MADSELKRKAGKKSKLTWFFCRKFARDCWGRRSCFQVSSCSFCLSFLFVSFLLFTRPSHVCVLSPSVLRWKDEDKCEADSHHYVAPCFQCSSPPWFFSPVISLFSLFVFVSWFFLCLPFLLLQSSVFLFCSPSFFFPAVPLVRLPLLGFL